MSERSWEIAIEDSGCPDPAPEVLIALGSSLNWGLFLSAKA
jgi:hypothetical protein